MIHLNRWLNRRFFREMARFLAALISFVLGDIQNPGLVEPSKCESCKFFTIELQSRLAETGKKKDVMRTGHGLDRKKKEIKVQNANKLLS